MERRRTVQADDLTHFDRRSKEARKLVMDSRADEKATVGPRDGCKLSEVENWRFGGSLKAGFGLTGGGEIGLLTDLFRQARMLHRALSASRGARPVRPLATLASGAGPCSWRSGALGCWGPRESGLVVVGKPVPPNKGWLAASRATANQRVNIGTWTPVEPLFSIYNALQMLESD